MKKTKEQIAIVDDLTPMDSSLLEISNYNKAFKLGEKIESKKNE